MCVYAGLDDMGAWGCVRLTGFSRGLLLAGNVLCIPWMLCVTYVGNMWLAMIWNDRGSRKICR